MSVDRFLSDTAEAFPDKTAIFYQNENITYKQLNQDTDSLANSLLDLGVKPQDSVAMILGNCPDFVRLYFAILRAGATIVPLNPAYKADELEFIIQDAQIRHIIVDSNSLPTIENIRSKNPSLKVIEVGNNSAHTISYQDLLNGSTNRVELPFDESRIAACLYTSGTSGKPKGALLSHRNLIFVTQACIERMDMKQDDNCLCIIPLFHIFSQLTNMLMPIYLGAKVTILPGFIPSVVLKEIANKKISYLCAVPAIYAAILSHLSQDKNRDLSSLRICISGGAPLPFEIYEFFNTEMGIPLIEGSGPTEAVACIGPPYANKPGSVGPPLKGVEVKIVDDNEEELPPGEVGEFCIKGPNVMQGYLNLPKATAQAIRGGWFHTGDLAKIDEDGYVYIVGRKKDMILVGGMNVYPAELEQVLSQHPKVFEAAVIGVPDKDRGEIPKAFIVTKPEMEAEPKEFILHCRRHLANYKCPREVVFVETLPKNTMGKVDKKQLS